MDDSAAKSVLLCRVKDDVEADLISNFLNEQGIPHMYNSFHSLALDGIFQFYKGFSGEILVREEDLTRAQSVLERYKAWKTARIVKDEELGQGD